MVRQIMNDTIEALTTIIMDMFKEYPRDWVTKAFATAYKATLGQHIEIDECGNTIWVKNKEV